MQAKLRKALKSKNFVRLLKSGGRTIEEIAKLFSVSRSTVYRWIKK